MFQIKQNLAGGVPELTAVPAARAGVRSVRIRTRTSLISLGTERMLVEFAKANYIEKMRQHPDKVRMVFDKIHTDGFFAALDSVRSKLDQPIALGYCNAGVVLDTGGGVRCFRSGQRVVSSGPHAEVVCVSKNLCAGIPKELPDRTAAFTAVGAIALQGIRLVQPTLGEAVVVTGLGLIGLIAVQLLRAHGCSVLGIDFDPQKLRLAQAFGAETVDLSAGENPVLCADRFSRGRGVDAVLIAAATRSNEPVHEAALMCRRRGRIVLVGVAGLELSRDDFYKKELSFQVSCSYGPGRHDPAYEEDGHDYPLSHVRWTAQRNFEAVMDMMADGRLNVDPLITHTFSFEDVAEAYKLLEGDGFHLGIILEYPRDKEVDELLRSTVLLPKPPNYRAGGLQGRPSIAFIGAGAYASKALIPAFKKTGAHLAAIASARGLTAAHAGCKFGFAEATTDTEAIIADPRVDTVVIATRHNSHASLVCRALKAGKHVYVEKPLALTAGQIDEIEDLYLALSGRPLLLVGFNRRFSPHVQKAKSLLEAIKGPKSFIYTVNAGAIPSDHWTRDPEVGGGRLLGEVCHFIDLLRYLSGHTIAEVRGDSQSSGTVSVHLTFDDGSLGSIHYMTSGHSSFSKERLEVFGDARILAIDNFRRMRGFGWPHFRQLNLWAQNKGSFEMVAAFVKAIQQGGISPIPFNELIEVSRATVKANMSAG